MLTGRAATFGAMVGTREGRLTVGVRMTVCALAVWTTGQAASSKAITSDDAQAEMQALARTRILKRLVIGCGA